MNWQIKEQKFWDPYTGGTIEIQSPGERSSSGKGWARKPSYFKGIIRKINVDSEMLIVTSDIIVTTDKVKEGKTDRTTSIKLGDIKEQSLPKKMVLHNGIGTVYLTEPSGLVKEPPKATEPEPVPEPEPIVRQYKDKVWETDFRYLAWLRHGSYHSLRNGENSLSREGRERIRKVADFLKSATELSTAPAIVLTSVSRRAFESGLIVADQFDCSVERYKCIGDESGDYYEYHEVLDTISKVHCRDSRSKYGVIIVVSHLPFCESAHGRIISELFQEETRPPRASYSPGNGMLVDLANFSYQAINVQDR